MISWSDVPLKLNGPGGLWRQRRRWYSGTIDVLRQRKFKKHSRYELFTISLLTVNLFMRWLLIASYIALVIIGKPIELIPIFLLLPIVAIVMQLYRLKKFGDQLDRWQYLFTITLVVNELYAAYREILYVYSIWLSYRRPKRSW
jgi:cellulose synthase/poly-beta-1,6-N-acetylglucosamine synthase-like glycosyltransferase